MAQSDGSQLPRNGICALWPWQHGSTCVRAGLLAGKVSIAKCLLTSQKKLP